MSAIPNERTGAGAVARGASVEASTSAVSWPAIIAGAFAAASVSLILLSLGSGLGLASVSPWSNAGASVTTFTVMTGIWLIIVQWVASGMGGYVTGRLRTKWVNTHSHEVFFRDTAHGFLTWTVATVISAALLASAASSVVGGGVRAGATVASGAAQGAASSTADMASQVGAYDIDTLFRSARPSTDASAADTRGEATRILATGLSNGDVSAPDRAYLAQLVAARTGLSDSDARKRVDDVITQVKAAQAKAREAADTARKAASAFSIFAALSMVIGAFIACAAAALGGQERDEHP
jgi:hypothetical protein